MGWVEDSEGSNYIRPDREEWIQFYLDTTERNVQKDVTQFKRVCWNFPAHQDGDPPWSKILSVTSKRFLQEIAKQIGPDRHAKVSVKKQGEGVETRYLLQVISAESPDQTSFD